MNEERVLYFDDVVIRLQGMASGSIPALRIEVKQHIIQITSGSVPNAAEKVYELLRECEVNWK